MKILLLIISIPLIIVSYAHRSNTDDDAVVQPVEADYPGTVLVQLFTSQGCSSCPPADVLLEEVKSRYDDVYVLSYHVDYWNRLGWADPFSKAEYTDLQYEYARKFRYGSVYTPQAVIDGKDHFVGSNKAKMTQQLGKFLSKGDENRIEVSGIVKKESSLSFEYVIEGETEGKTLKAALVLDEETTYVSRGENRKRTLTNSNIVIREKEVTLSGSGKGKLTLDFPESDENSREYEVVVFLQDSNLNILAATSS